MVAELGDGLVVELAAAREHELVSLEHGLVSLERQNCNWRVDQTIGHRFVD
jgi:hypothetical protein